MGTEAKINNLYIITGGAMNYTFKEAAEKLNKTQSQIDSLIKDNIIKLYLVEVLGYPAAPQSTKRIKRLKYSLDNYVIEHLDEDPTKLILQHGSFKLKLSENQKELLRNAPNGAFNLLLDMCNISIEEIRLLIPSTELSRYNRRLKRIAKKRAAAKADKIVADSCIITEDNRKSAFNYIVEQRGQGVDDAIIAVKLCEQFTGINAFDFYGLLYPKELERWNQSVGHQGRPRQWFYDLKKKGEKMIWKQKMTTSEIT